MDAERTHYLGAFNHLNVKDWEGLALSLIEGDRVVIEYREPLSIPASGEIEVRRWCRDTALPPSRGRTRMAENASYGPFGNSGACNINVNCPEGDDWQVENQSVALIVNGGFAACSGALVNNTANDGTPYFLTANHCLGAQHVDLLLQPREFHLLWQHRTHQQQHFRRNLLVNNGGSDVPHSIELHPPALERGIRWLGRIKCRAFKRSRHSPPFWRCEEDLL